MADGSTKTRGTETDAAAEHTSSMNDEGKPPQRDLVLAAVLGAELQFWRDFDENAYATVPSADGDRLERYCVRSRRFESVVRRIYGAASPRTVAGRRIPGSISDATMREVKAAVEAMALAAVPPCQPEVRVLRDAGAIWLDLGGEDWRTVRVDAEGWRVVDRADVPLIRPEGMRALPVPVREERAVVMGVLRRLLNLSTGRGNRDLKLVLAWLLATLYPDGPYTVLAVDGEQGAGKSTTCRMLRRLIDPSKAPLRAPPRNEEDLVIAASSARVVALDNVSLIEAPMADALCRLATGNGISKRRLFTDAEECLIAIARPVLLNGIPSLLTRADLADRALAITLPAIPDAERRPETDVWADFDRAAPGVLALLLDALATALRNRPALRLPRLPRMADFAHLACAAAPAFGWTAAEMLEALEANREDAAVAVVEADPVAEAVRAIVAERFEAGKPDWTGTATNLLEEVNQKVLDGARSQRGFPKDAARLSTRLKRLAPALHRVGVDVLHAREGGTGGRMLELARAPAGGSGASQPSPSVTDIRSKNVGPQPRV